MNSININNYDFSKFRKIKAEVNYESSIYVYKDRLYKLLNEDCLSKHREENIEELSNFNNPNCVFPENKIVNNYGEFLGVEEEYLKGYKTLAFYLNHNYLEYEKRKQIAYKICEIQNYLDNNNISFVDMHSNNLMIKDDNLKLIDLDSAEIINERSEVFNYIRRELICRNLAISCYQALFGYNINVYNVRRDRIARLLSKANANQADFLYKVFDSSNREFLDVRIFYGGK